jgi:chromosome segregation ATPase
MSSSVIESQTMSDDEMIPDAPAFCQRFSPEEAERLSKKLTADSMLQLGAKIQSDIVFHKEQERRSGLKELDNNIRLSELLYEYFELDSQGQKARMLELFTELEKMRKSNKEFKTTIDRLQREYQQEKEDREEYSEQCDNYIAELDEKDAIIKGLNRTIGQMQDKIDHLEQTISTTAKNHQGEKRYYRVRITQLSLLIGGISAYYLSPVLNYLF